MPTLLNRTFEFIRVGYGQEKFDRNGKPNETTVETITVRGTVQPITGKDTVGDDMASRNTGSVKVYSSERLDFRSVDGNGRGFVRCGGFVYELMDELPYQNLGPISHWKYIANLVPPHLRPEDLFVPILVADNGKALVDDNDNFFAVKI